ITVTLITKGSIAGNVTDSCTGLAISGVSITIGDSLDISHTATTDDSGGYTVSGINRGGFTVLFEKAGYENNSVTGTLNAGETKTLNVQLTPIKPLTVKIISPLDGEVLSVSAVDVEGTVSDPAARIAVNGIEATVSENTFEAKGVQLTAGPNPITATAVDDNGRTASDTVTVTVNNNQLNISITDPSDGEVLSTQSASVEGMINDPSAYVEVNGIPASVSSDGNFVANGINLFEGTNLVTAQGVNVTGQTAEDTVRIYYQPISSSLSVNVLSPFDGSEIEAPYFTVSGIVSDPSATVLVNDTLANVEDNFYTASIYACEEPIAPELPPQQSWECTVTVNAYSDDGQVAVSYFTYLYTPSENPFTVRITDPVNNGLVAYSPYYVEGEIDDVLSEVFHADVTVNGVSAAISGGDHFSAPVSLVDGVNYITVSATNIVGHDAFDTVKVFYEPPGKPLSVTIYSPLDRAIVNYSPVTVYGGVSHGSAEVQVTGSETIDADMNQDLRSFRANDVPLSPGENIIEAWAYMPNEDVAVAEITVIYDPDYPSPPTPVLNPLPEYTSKPFIEVAGLALPSHKAEVFVSGNFQGTAYADSQGIFKITVRLPEEGSNHIVARTVDSYGNKSGFSEGVSVKRDTMKPFTQKGLFYIDEWGLAVSRVMIAGKTEDYARVEISIDYDPEYKYTVTANDRGEFFVYTHLSSGQHLLWIKTTDSAGNTAVLDEIHTVHNPLGVLPIPPVIDPLPNPVDNTDITIEGNAYSGFTVEVYRDSELMGTTLANNRGRFRLDGVTLVPGTNIIWVTQKENQIEMNNRYIMVEAADSPKVTVDSVSGTLSRPEVNIDFPLDGSVTDAIFLPLRGSVDTPGAIVRTNGHYNSYANRGYAYVADGRFVSGRKIPLLPGENVLFAEAISPDGSRGVDRITVYSEKDASVPSVEITSPAKGEEVYERFIPVTGTISSSVEKVIVNEAEAALGSGAFTSEADIFGDYVDNAEGYETMITAWAMDGSGKIGHSDTYPKYRHIEPPALSVLSPMNGETLPSSPVVVTGEIYGASEVLINGISAMIDGN
ncbi:MAG: carboxypeptidase regulatory-like domain-containing protein, partial [Nitrospirota bacterium]